VQWGGQESSWHLNQSIKYFLKPFYISSCHKVLKQIPSLKPKEASSAEAQWLGKAL
jgi:hypothetical protein